MIEKLRKINRALLELELGILVWGILCQVIGMWFAPDKLRYTLSLWLGILLSLAGVYHMYRSLDKALDLGPDASRIMIINNMIRYVVLVMVLGLIAVTDRLYPLITFMGYMGMKTGAYMQPVFTHKLCNRFFHETDPVAQAIPDEEWDRDREKEE